MTAALAVILGALSRRLVGWGGCPRWPGLVLAAVAVVIAMWGKPPLAILLCAVAVPLAYGLPKHGESMNRPLLMGLRNGAFTVALAAALVFGFGLAAWTYAPVGFLVGVAYWLAKRYAPPGPEGGFYDGWVSAAELALGALLVVGLLLVSVAPARAQSAPPCTLVPLAEVVAELAAQHEEPAFAEFQASAPRGQGAPVMITITAQPDGGSWTVLMTVPGGVTCIRAAGDHWRAVGGE